MEPVLVGRISRRRNPPLARDSRTFAKVTVRAAIPRPKIGIAVRKRPDRMKVVLKNDKRVDLERIVPTCGCNSYAQGVNMLDEESSLSIEQIDGEDQQPPETSARR